MTVEQDNDIEECVCENCVQYEEDEVIPACNCSMCDGGDYE